MEELTLKRDEIGLVIYQLEGLIATNEYSGLETVKIAKGIKVYQKLKSEEIDKELQEAQKLREQVKKVIDSKKEEFAKTVREAAKEEGEEITDEEIDSVFEYKFRFDDGVEKIDKDWKTYLSESPSEIPVIKILGLKKPKKETVEFESDRGKIKISIQSAYDSLIKLGVLVVE